MYKMTHFIGRYPTALFLVFSLGLGVISYLNPVNAFDATTGIFSPQSSPYDLTYGQWSAKWWQWALSIPNDVNPINDHNGTYCTSNQNDKSVWFLAGSGGGKVTRDCSMPSGKAIFFPIMDVECSYPENPTAKTESELRQCAHADQDTVTHLTLSIDGTNIENLTAFRTDSPLFNFTTPDNGIFDLHSVNSQAVSDGYFVMLKPLPVGTHEIHWSGVLGSSADISPINQPEDVKYILKIH
jgi:hypothetical protein